MVMSPGDAQQTTPNWLKSLSPTRKSLSPSRMANSPSREQLLDQELLQLNDLRHAELARMDDLLRTVENTRSQFSTLSVQHAASTRLIKALREENDKLRAALAGEQVLLHGLVAKPELNQRMGTAAGWDSAQYSIHTGELLAVAPVAPVAIGFREGQAVEVIVGGEWRPGRIYDENEAEGTYDVALQGGKYVEGVSADRLRSI